VDFLKKNWGLVLVSVLCFAGAVAVSWLLIGAMKAADASKAKLDSEFKFFDTVQKENVKLSDENRATAQQNEDWAKERFERLRSQLHAKYRIEVQFDADPYRAVQELRAKVNGLATRLDEAEIELTTQSQYLSFEDYTQKNVMPRKEDMPELFRQFKIVEEIVAQAIQNKVAMINSIARPMLLQRRQDDLYHSIPIDLSVTGSAQAVSDFVNSFHSPAAKYLFFIRKVEFSSPDQAPGGVLGGTGTTGMGGMGGMDMGMEGGMGGGMGMPSPRPGRRRGTMPGAEMGMETGAMPGMDGGMGTGMGGAAAMPVLLTREQLLAFQDRYITAVVRLDLVEFTTPE
jgi:hypothetical protein